MNWARRYPNDKDPKHYKEWRAGRGRYRIIWRDKAFEVSVPSAYQCCVRVFIPETGRPMWDFIDRKRPFYRTFKAAKDACEKHADSNYKPARKKKKKAQQEKPKRKAPMKTCPQCEIKIHVRKAMCNCGYNFKEKK